MRFFSGPVLISIVLTHSPLATAAGLDVWDAMQTAVSQNFDVRLSDLTKDDRAAGVTRSQGEFDTNLSGTFTRDHSETPSSSSLDGVTSVIRSDTTTLKPTLTTKSRIGTELSVPYSYSISESNSSFSRIPVGHNTSLGLKITQPLLKSMEEGYYQRNVKRAELDLEIAKAKHGEKIDDVAMRAAEIFLDALKDRESVKLQEALLVNTRMAEEFVNAKHAVGKASMIDRLEAEAATSKSEESLLSAKTSLANRIEDLGAHVYGKLQAELQMNDDLGSLLQPAAPLDFDTIKKEALSRRSEWLAQVKASQKARVEFAASEVDLRPNLSFEGSYTQKGLDQDFQKSQAQVDNGTFPSWSAGVKFERPLMRFAARSANESKRLQFEQQSIKEAQLARDLELELKKALRDVDVGWQRLGALSNAARAQKQRFEAISAKFKAGLVSITTLDKARADAESSELESIKARFAYAKSRLKLAAARGLLLEAAKSRRI